MKSLFMDFNKGVGSYNDIWYNFLLVFWLKIKKNIELNDHSITPVKIEYQILECLYSVH